MNSNLNTSSKPLVWRQEVNIYGNKIFLDTTGTAKMWAVKVYNSYKKFKTIKFQYNSIKRPIILKFLILAEVGVWAYSYLNISHIDKSVNDVIRNHPLYKVLKKDSNMDYIVNIALYGTLGKTLYITNKYLFYSLFLLATPFSFYLYKINKKIKNYAEEILNIEDFEVCNPSPNIIPKMILSTSIMLYLNYFLRNDRLKLMAGFTIDKKVIFMFMWVYFSAKILQFTSNFTTETINLASVDGTLAILLSTLLINKTYLLKFLFIFYFNPYSLAVWFSAKNNVEEEFVKDEYQSKNMLKKMKTYLTYNSLVACSNMLKIYF